MNGELGRELVESFLHNLTPDDRLVLLLLVGFMEACHMRDGTLRLYLN